MKQQRVHEQAAGLASRVGAHRLVHLALASDFTAARNIQHRYFRLMDINFVETNPTPVKTGMALIESRIASEVS